MTPRQPRAEAAAEPGPVLGTAARGQRGLTRAPCDIGDTARGIRNAALAPARSERDPAQQDVLNAQHGKFKAIGLPHLFKNVKKH